MAHYIEVSTILHKIEKYKTEQDIEQALTSLAINLDFVTLLKINDKRLLHAYFNEVCYELLEALHRHFPEFKEEYQVFLVEKEKNQIEANLIENSIVHPSNQKIKL